MGFTEDPLYLAPRLLPRRWGKQAMPAWCPAAPRPPSAIGEIWLAHANNTAHDGHHFAEALAQSPQTMLGDLGRVPPSVRLLVSDEPTDVFRSEGALSLWRIIESPLDNVLTARDHDDAPVRRYRARRGDMFRAEPGVSLSFGGDVTALEVRANFSPANRMGPPHLRRLERAPERAARETWFRDAALSVECWTLPEMSSLEPDGETCHILMALTPGVAIDGRPLHRGDAVFLPAEGRRCLITGRGAQILASYPDIAPTEIWKPVRPPRPASLAVDPRAAARTQPDQSYILSTRAAERPRHVA